MAKDCADHARLGMVHVASKKCGYECYSKQASYGVAESPLAEFCANHARAGMVDLTSKKCDRKGCSKTPS